MSGRPLPVGFPPCLCLALLLALGLGCQQVYEFDHSSCIFHVDYHDNSCSTFEFQSCTWEHVSGLFFASSETHTSTSWTQCTNACCGQTHAAMTYDVIAQCQDYLNSQQQQRNIIFWVFIGGILFLVVLCICCKARCSECCQKLKECCNRGQVEDEIAPEPGSFASLSAGYGAGERNWKPVTEPNQHFHNPCSVCLDEGPRLELQCKHVFHRGCILAWLNKKYECLLCRSRRIDQIRVYCQSCGEYYFDASLRRVKTYLEKHKQVCENCELGKEK